LEAPHKFSAFPIISCAVRGQPVRVNRIVRRNARCVCRIRCCAQKSTTLRNWVADLADAPSNACRV